jgi:glycerol-3-phosphate acyltransferase PlsY
LTATKLIILAIFVYFTVDPKLLRLDSLESLIQFEQSDFNHLISFLISMKLLEMINYLAIYRWRQNIKRDIFKSISNDIKHLRIERQSCQEKHEPSIDIEK